MEIAGNFLFASRGEDDIMCVCGEARGGDGRGGEENKRVNTWNYSNAPLTKPHVRSRIASPWRVAILVPAEEGTRHVLHISATLHFPWLIWYVYKQCTSKTNPILLFSISICSVWQMRVHSSGCLHEKATSYIIYLCCAESCACALHPNRHVLFSPQSKKETYSPSSPSTHRNPMI